MTTKLKVLSRQKGLARQKSAFIVEYEGKEKKVTMFEFQESEPDPETIECNIDNGIIKQDIRTLYDRFYPERDTTYIFKVKEKFRDKKLYEVIDPRIENDGVKQRLMFSESCSDMEKGQIIKCSIKDIKGSRLILHLEERDPLIMEFIALESIFDDDTKKWLDILFEEVQLSEIRKMYENKDGRWIFLFAKEMERIVYFTLSEKGDFLRTFCVNWLNVVEHSPFIAEMSDDQTKTYGADLAKSIEVCEDFLDALNVPDKDSKVLESINSLDPTFYQFRIEKRLRFLACAFSFDFSRLERNIQPLLEKLKVMGEKKCCEESVSTALIYILKLHVNKTSHELEDALSYDSNGTIVIKNCALSLCYLTRIMYRCGDEEVSAYTSRLYQILSLWHIFPEEEKLKLLRNSYTSLFIDKCPLLNYQWEIFDTIVINRSYLLCREDVPYDRSMRLVYNDGNTEVEMLCDGFSLAPMNNLKSNMTRMQMVGGLSANLCYGKSLSRLSQEPDFGNVQSIWNTVEKSVFAPARIIKKVEEDEPEELSEGRDVDIYITEIIDEETAKCRAVDYDVEGEIPFGDLFFYNKPMLEIGDFMAPDGSPMLFPAIYRKYKGKATFSSRKHRIEYAKERIPIAKVICCVISQASDGWLAISEEGFFLNFKSDDETMEPLRCVELFVIGVKYNGYGEAEFCGFSEATFDNRKAYVNYLKGMNDYFYGEEGTLEKAEESFTTDIDVQEEPKDVKMLSRSHISALANVIFKLSRFEKELRQRYGYLCIGSMLSMLIHDEGETAMYSIRMKYTKMLYDFSINNKLLDMDVDEFVNGLSRSEYIKEVREMENIVRILGRYGKTTQKNTLDETLVSILTTDATPLEKELSRLVLTGNMLTNFKNRAIEDQILSEMGNKLNIRIVKKEPVSIGLEEGKTVEFKTSIVYPPTGDANEDIDLQSDNIAREISALMNTDGGTLYIGVNDFGNVVGLQSDLDYFSSENGTKARDKFRNHFSVLLTNKFGSVTASKFIYDFEEVKGYTIFKVIIPQIPGAGGDYVRVGTTCQRK